MTPEEKQQNFHRELIELLGKYEAEITIEDFGKGYSSNPKIVVDFKWDVRFEDIGTPQLILGTYICKD